MNEVMILQRGVCHDMSWMSNLAPEKHGFLCFTIFFSLFFGRAENRNTWEGEIVEFIDAQPWKVFCLGTKASSNEHLGTVQGFN